MTAPLESARGSVTDVSKNSAATSEILETLQATIIAAAQILGVQALDIVAELKTRLQG